MPSLQANISYGTDTNGQGFLQVDSISVVNQGTVTVQFIYQGTGGTNYTPAFPPTTTPYKMSGVPAGTYQVQCWQGATQGTVKSNGTVYSTASIEIDTVNCDLVVTSVSTVSANSPAANGSATIYYTGSGGAVQYSLNGSTWQSSNVFNGLAADRYTAYVRYTNLTGCIASKTFSVKSIAVLGCTNPDADNYNPNATQDNGTCIFYPKYYATGGTMPNPVWIQKSYATTTGFPATPKTKHFITLNLYNVGSNVPFASKIARVRNGVINVDISKDLQIGKLNLTLGNGLITEDNAASFAFEIGFVENYNGRAYAETRSSYPKRFAVRAALPNINDDITSNVLQQKSGSEEAPQAEFLTAFDVPVKFVDEPICLAMVIDDSAYFNGQVYNSLYLERSYFDNQGRLVQRNSNPVYETGFVRFEINDSVVPCVAYMEVCLNTDLRQQDGQCIGEEIPVPITPPDAILVKDTSGNVMATVPAGSDLIIQSGFSFGFGILG